MHRISELEIKNFRSCQLTKLLVEAFSPLVGYNNAGKSNVLKAVDALVKAKTLTKEEFNNLDHPLEIVATIKGLSNEVLSHLSSVQKSSFEPFLENESVRIRFYQEEPKSTRSAVNLGIKAPSDLSDTWEESSNISKAVLALFPEPTFINSISDLAPFLIGVALGTKI